MSPQIESSQPEKESFQTEQQTGKQVTTSGTCVNGYPALILIPFRCGWDKDTRENPAIPVGGSTGLILGDFYKGISCRQERSLKPMQMGIQLPRADSNPVVASRFCGIDRYFGKSPKPVAVATAANNQNPPARVASSSHRRMMPASNTKGWSDRPTPSSVCLVMLVSELAQAGLKLGSGWAQAVGNR